MKIKIMVASAALMSNPIFAQSEEEDVIVVVADKSTTSVGEVNAQVDVKSLAEIERLNATSYADLLADIPGLLFEGGPIVTGEQITLRAQGGSAVTVKIDGAKQNFVSGHAGQRFFIDSELLSEVQVLKGGASNLYGAGSAGVVAIDTLKAEDFIDRSSGQLNSGGRVRTGYQDVNSEEIGSLVYALGNDKWSILAGAVYRDSNELELSNGVELEGSALLRRNFLVKADYYFNQDFNVSLGYQYYRSNDQNGANPQATISSTSNTMVNRELEFQQLNLKFNYNPIDNDLVNLNGNVFYNRTNQERFYQADPTASNFERFNQHELNSFGIDLYNEANFYAWGGEHQLITGVELIKDNQDGFETRDTFFVPGTTNSSSGRPDAEQNNLAIYVRDKVKWDNGLSLAAGVRYDYFDTRNLLGADASHSDSQFSPKVEMRYELNQNISFYTTYGLSFNAPTLNQLYADGSHFGVVPTFGATGFTGYFEDNFTNNEDLVAERSRDLELGVDLSGEWDVFSWNAKVTYFDKKGKDTIDSVVADTSFNPAFVGSFGPGALFSTFTQSVNVDSTSISGWEGQLNLNGDRWFATGGFHAIDGTIDGGGLLNSTPGDSLYVSVGFDVLENLNVSWDSRFVGGREDKVSEENSQTSGYDIHGINVHWQATDNFALTTGVSNLFDQEYEVSNVNRTEAGRNLFVTGTVSF